MPEVLQVVTMANPLRFAIDMVQRIYLEGVGLGTLWPNMVPLLLIALLTLPLAAWLFRHRLT
jgi:ABC-2 type transport system permease protein